MHWKEVWVTVCSGTRYSCEFLGQLYMVFSLPFCLSLDLLTSSCTSYWQSCPWPLTLMTTHEIHRMWWLYERFRSEWVRLLVKEWAFTVIIINSTHRSWTSWQYDVSFSSSRTATKSCSDTATWKGKKETIVIIYYSTVNNYYDVLCAFRLCLATSLLALPPSLW